MPPSAWISRKPASALLCWLALSACGFRTAPLCAKLPDEDALRQLALRPGLASLATDSDVRGTLGEASVPEGWQLSHRLECEPSLYQAVAANQVEARFCDEIVRVAMSYRGHVGKRDVRGFVGGQCARLRRADGSMRGLIGTFHYDREPEHDEARMREALGFLEVRLDGRQLAAFEEDRALETWRTGRAHVGEVAGYAYESHPGLLHSTASESVVGNYYGIAIASGAAMIVLELQAEPCTSVDRLRSEGGRLLAHLLAGRRHQADVLSDLRARERREGSHP